MIRTKEPRRRAALPAPAESRELPGDAIGPPDGAFEDVERLPADQAYSESIMDSVRDPLVVLDEQLKIVSANRSFYAIFALEPRGTVGRHIATVGQNRLDTPLLNSFLARIGAGRDLVEDYEIAIDLPALGRRTLVLSGRQIGGTARASRHILVAIVDVTERKRINATLQAATAAAEQASLAKSRFLAAASHDLRQPLQTMSVLHGILRRTVKDPQAHALADKLDDTLSAMTGMLDALLDINQIEAGVVRAEPTDFRLEELLAPLRTEFAYHTAAKGLGLRTVPSSAVVRSDRALLEQVLRNLLSNAVKYTETGRILLGCRKRGDKIRIEVRDTGIGIADEHLEAIFQEFHQIGNSARQRSAGLGLGLFIARRLAELMGHPIEVRSKLGSGSLFSVELPTALLGAPPIPEQKPDAAASSETGSILIIDDDPATRDMLVLLFGLDGHIVAAAGDPLEALALIERGPFRPDVILADYNLPGMTGLQLAAELRVRLRPELPVIILTGDISSESLRKISGAGCVQLTKPIKAKELSELIHSVLAAQPAPPVAAAAGRAEAADAGEDETIFVLDDDTALREALVALLEADGRSVESFAGAEQFLAAYKKGRKGCLMVDVRLPGMSGLALLERLKAEGANLPAVMITGHGDVPSAVRAMEAGAAGFIEKPVAPNILFAAIDRALAEGRDQAEVSSRRSDAALRIARLTARERQVMDLVVAGNANKEIAFRLGINQRTVENHRAMLMKKTGTASLADLIHLEFAARRVAGRGGTRMSGPVKKEGGRQL